MLRAVAGGSGSVTSVAWADIGSAVTAGSGAERFVTNLGANGIRVISNGTRWRPASGSAVLKALAAPVSGVTNSETIILQTLIPAAFLQTGDVVRLWITLNKSGTTDAGNLGVRIGTAGTTADTAISGIGYITYLAAAQQSGGFATDLAVVSATSWRKIGTGGAVPSYSGPTATAENSATAGVANVSSALYVSVSIGSAGATNTVGATTAWLELRTP